MKWKLLTQHYINDALLDEGTIVGDAPCQHNFNGPDGKMYRPSMNMEPADAEAEAYIKANPRKFEGKAIPAELQVAPPNIQPGQRVGGQGPAAVTTGPQVPGQGPPAGSGAALDSALIQKALNEPAKPANPFAT